MITRHHALVDILCQTLQISLAHLAIPPIRQQVRPKLLVPLGQILARQPGHKKVRDQDAHHTAYSRDNKRPPLAEPILNRCKRLCPHSSARLANRRTEAVARSTDAGGVALRRNEAEHIARAQVARTLHQAVKDDKERDDGGDFVVRAANDQPKDQVSRETQHHDVLAAQPVAEECAEENAGQGNSAEEKLPLRRAAQGAAGPGGDAGDDGAGEDAVGEGDKVVEEPGAAGADQRFPVVPDDQAVGDVPLDGAAAVELGVEHLEAEVEDGQGQRDADAEADAPHGREVGLAGGGQHDEEDGHGERAAEREGEIGDEDEDGAAVRGRVFVGGLGCGRAGGRVLAT